METVNVQTGRAETLERIDHLGRVDSLTDDARRFLKFCFRASDHAIYYAAADCLGTWLPRDEPLAEWFREYCRSRGLTPGTAVALDGERSHRRVLLAGAAAAVADPQGWAPPLQLDSAIAAPRAPADIAALLEALRLLRTSEAWSDLVDARLGQLLPDISADEHAMGHPGVAGRWAQLSTLLLNAGQASLAAPLREALARRLESAAGGTVAERLGALHAADAMVRAVATTAAEPGVVLDGIAFSDAGVWIAQRWARAAWRDGCPVPPESGGATASRILRAEQAALAIAAQTEADAFLGADPVTAGEQHLFEVLRPLLTRADRWLAQPPGERALALFGILDRIDDASPLPIPAADLRDDAIADATQATGRAEVLLGVLARLAAWERLPLARLIEVRRLHALADPHSSLMLLPAAGDARIDSELATALADLLEHQLRMALATRPDFDPTAYLSLALVRHPPRTVADALQRLLADRRYQNTEGEDVDLVGLVRTWTAAVAEPSTAAAPWRRLPAFTVSEGGPLATLRDLSRWLGLEPDNRPRPDSVAALLQQLHGSSTSVVGGDAHGMHATMATLLDSVREQVREQLDRAEQLENLARHDPDDAQVLLVELLNGLERSERALARHLPAPDRLVLAAGFEHLRALLARWRDGLTLCARWAREGASAPPGALPEALLPALLAALLRRHAATDDPKANTLEHCLDITPDLPDSLQSAWQQALAGLWAECLQDAMASERSARVGELLAKPRHQPLAQRPESATVLTAARRFCFDRLHLQRARHVAWLEGNHGVTRCIGAFVFHYSAVWIGLLVGAILMLDFGDAWKAMAEAGDIHGITVTGLLGLGGTWAYLLVVQRQRLQPLPGTGGSLWPGLIARTLCFLLLCATFTLAATSGLWLLLSGTDEVVQGPNAIGHIIVWAGFALLIGTFLGLVAKDV